MAEVWKNSRARSRGGGYGNELVPRGVGNR